MDHYFTNNQNLKSEIKTINYSHNGCDFVFLSDNGVFSKEHIDYGSKLLVETFLKYYKQSGSVLDVGCGYGFMGIVVAKKLQSNVTMVDVNRRALHLAERNLSQNKVEAKVYESNGYEKVTGKFDVIITNPPVRAGKKVLLDILINAKEHLNNGGELWYVLRKDQGAKSIEKILNEHYQVEIVEKSKGFYIFCCKIY
ncbi:MAG: class I SAM-dependent methyltransferase [Firmicutes bacterium]|nr:class I SAM-dependent methyltransferase [Bacillota bacterium]